MLFRVYGSNIDFPIYNADADLGAFPQELTLDYSPIDNASPSTDASGMDHNSAYQDLGNDFNMYEDIYGATVQLPTPVHDVYNKNLVQQFAAFSAAELFQPQQAHLSPIGQGNAMLYTPQSMNDVDEGFDEHHDYSGLSDGNNGADFILFPGNRATKPMFHESLFAPEVPSMAAGYSQPSSQDLMNAFNVNMDWSA